MDRVSGVLAAYLRHEEGLAAAESAGDEAAAEIIREKMDGLWRLLSDEERRSLEERRP